MASVGTSASIKLTVSPRWGVELIKVVCVFVSNRVCLDCMLASHQKRSLKLMWVGGQLLLFAIICLSQKEFGTCYEKNEK